jgi:methyltransferase (TIGR00027 family)
LDAAGFDNARHTVWIWEGVTMYLDAAAVETSLAGIAAMSAPGSTLLATYVTPQITARPGWLGQAGTSVLALVSEPIRSTGTPAQMRERLGRLGFEVARDVLPADAAEDFGLQRVRRHWAMPDEHVLVARKV